MLKIFTYLADFLTFTLFRMDESTRLAHGVHFFIEDVTKILTLVALMIYIISLLRAGLNTERVRQFLSGKNRFFAYFLASVFGAITPFCSCSSIPLFLGFTSARIPLGITMAFLITSPMINEAAVIALGSTLGLEFTLLYVITGMISGMLGGFFIDLIGAEKYLTPIGTKASQMGAASTGHPHHTSAAKISLKGRHDFARNEVKEIFVRIWKWVILGVGLGALIHQFVPQNVITERLGDGQWWTVPAAVVLGIPLYSNATGVIPAMEALITKGLPVGTALALMMSVVAASFPEFMLLKQVMKPKLLIIFFLMLLVLFTLAGWVFNAIYIV